MKIYFSILFFIIIMILPKSNWAQAFGQWDKLWSDNLLKVEVAFKQENSSCSTNTKHKIQYRVEGKLSNFPNYLIWTTDYIDCNGKTIFQEHSLNISTENPFANGSNDAYGDTWTAQEEEFLAESIVTKFYDIHTANNASRKTGVKKQLISTEANSISGKETLIFGNPTILKVEGGMLGSGANWVWYSSNCGGTYIGTGNSMEDFPTSTTSYFVRAEGPNGITNCVGKTVKIISLLPSSIEGKKEIFEGQETELLLTGGHLTDNAAWTWYENDLNNNASKIGTGSIIKISPKTTTRYFVRAESTDGTTNKLNFEIIVYPKNPKEILGNNILTFGESTTLVVNGGHAGENENWIWYQDKLGGKEIGRGQSIDLSPIDSTVYFVRIEGDNYKSDAVSKTILISPASVNFNKKFPYFNNITFARNGTIDLNYEIKGSKIGDNFNIKISGINRDKILLSERSTRVRKKDLNSDFGLYKWDFNINDSLYSKKIYFDFEATNKVSIPLGIHLLKSLVCPGWGDYKIRNKKYYLLYGVLSYSLIYGSYYFNQTALSKYSEYKLSFNKDESNKLFNQAILNRNLSYVSFGLAAIVWTCDLTGIIIKIKKLKKDIAPSKYYYARDNYVFKGRSKLE